MRGYGDSDKPKNISDYQIENLSNDIKEFVAALGRKKFYLIAHDWGAVISWRYVYQNMETIEKYVCIGGPPSSAWTKKVFSSLDQFLKSWYIFFFQAPYLPEFFCRMHDLKIMKAIGSFKFNEYFSEEDLEAYKYTFSKSGAFTGPINYYRNISRQKKEMKSSHEFAPGLFLLGDGDKYIGRDSLPEAQLMYKNLKTGLIPNANHFAQQDNPVETNKLIREFLKK